MGVTAGQFWGAVLALAVSIIGTMIKMHLQNRADAAKDREAQRERDIKWDTILIEHPIHSHCDIGPDETQLRKGSIRYAKHSA